MEPRIKIDEPDTQHVIPMEYKPLNEVIIPQEQISDNVQQMLDKKEEIASVPKQWKTKQIYEFIQQHKENEYKKHCEAHNTIQENWNEIWNVFILSVKGKSYIESESIIKAFVENLRRIRHNQLCAKDIVEKENREVWPATTVVRAFLEGKIDKFKDHMEQHRGEKQEDPKWIIRWTKFVSSLEHNHLDEQKLNSLCSKFMTAQRINKYRKSFHSGKDK
jgi:excinuclease UvrABC ATPase subunit